MEKTVSNMDEYRDAIKAGCDNIRIRGGGARITGDVPADVMVLVASGSTFLIDQESRGIVKVLPGGDAFITGTAKAVVHKGGRATLSDDAEGVVYGNATLLDNARAVARDNAVLTAYENSHVVATGHSTVNACGAAEVEASDVAVVYRHSLDANIIGGIVVDATKALADGIDWANTHCLWQDGRVVVYKAVDGGLCSLYGFRYPIGDTVRCDDWSPQRSSGHGLHFSPTPFEASLYDQDSTRFLKCLVNPSDIVPLGADKCKVPSAIVACEVDLFGNEIR